MSNVLMNPSSVVEKVRLVFPQAQIESKVTCAGFELECTLVANSRSFRIYNMLDANEFDLALRELFDKLTFCQTFQQPIPEIQLDIERFSLVPPLSEWKVFQREIFKKSSIFSEDLIERYLSTNDANLMQQLMQLGLAPFQIATDCSEQDLQIFRSLCYRLQKAKNAINSRIFSNLEKNYPTVFSKILEEMKSKVVRADSITPYQDILENLTKRVIGQDKASELLATALASQNNQNGNMVFLFVGPTGVGKTEMAKAVASIKENRFVMLPMNQYQTEWSMSNLFGAPIGILGSGDKPHLAKELEKFSPIKKSTGGSTKVYEIENVVLLFDELEKAHHQVKQSMLTLFDEGYCSIQYASRGGSFSDDGNISEKYVFKKSIFIGTSNLYHQRIITSFRNGRALQDIAIEFINFNSTHPIATSFSPEFLGRFSKVIPFGPIPRGPCYKSLIQIKINDQMALLKKELSCQEIRLENEDQVLDILQNLLYGEGIDLRRIKAFFDCNVKAVIYSKINQLIDLSKAILTIAPYSDELIGVKASGLFLGKLVDVTDLFQVRL